MPSLQVDDVIKTYKNENVTSSKLRSAAVNNIVRLPLLLQIPNGHQEVRCLGRLVAHAGLVIIFCMVVVARCQVEYVLACHLQSDGKRNLSKHLNATEAALADKVRTCQEAKARLDKAILDIDLELQHLTRTTAKLQKLLSRREAALDLSEKRLKVCWRCAVVQSVEQDRVQG
jgi:hypothetical protein